MKETWLRPDISDAAVNIDAYKFLSQNRTNRRGGGVGMYVKHDMVSEILISTSFDYIECLWVKLKRQNDTVIIGNLYRPPNSNITQFLNYLEDILSNLYIEYDKIICLGDFNINMLNLESNLGVQLEAVFSPFNMSQIIKEPTRISLLSISLIDLIFTNIKPILDSGVIDSNIADHFVTYIKVGPEKVDNAPVSFFYRSIKNINMNQFQADLEEIGWHDMLYLQNIDQKINFLNFSILSLFDMHAPLKQFRKNKNYNYAPWITENIKLMQKLRNKALKKYKQSKNSAHYEYYKQLRNYTTSAIRSEKKAYLRTKFQNSNYKEKWQEMKKLNLLKQTNFNLPSNLSNPNNINSFFINSVVINSDPKPEILNFYNNNTLENITESFKFNLSTENEIFELIKNIKSKATGADKINITMIYLCCPFIVPFITHIINESILNLYFPTEWKKAHAIPLPKISNPTDYGHLRCISILPTLSKILEKIMENQIRIFLNQFNILPLHQSGFRANHSCESALAHVTDDILRAADENKVSTLISLDFSKAFDMLNHEILYSILHYVGFSDDARTFLKSFLSDRTQQVVYNRHFSDPLHISVGVPQGSILGPLLYTIYTSNFYKSLKHCKSHFYADDTQLYYSFSLQQVAEVPNLINSDLAQFHATASDHLLKLNPSKSSVVIFGNQSQVESVKNNIEIRLNNVALPFSNSCKSLGLILDTRLRFKEYVTSKLRICYGTLKLIYSHRHSLSRDIRKLLCDTLILSQFNHCIGVYYPCLDAADRYRVQKVQNACLRLIYGIRRRAHISPFIVQSKWLNMFNRFRLHMSCFCFKIIKYKIPRYLYEKMNFRTDIHNRNLRRQHLLTVPQHRKEIFKRSFSYNAAYLINSLDIDFSHSNFAFKNSVKKCLLRLQ